MHISFQVSIFFFFSVALQGLRDLSSLIKHGPVAVNVQSPNYWTTREFPQISVFIFFEVGLQDGMAVLFLTFFKKLSLDFLILFLIFYLSVLSLRKLISDIKVLGVFFFLFFSFSPEG